MKLAAVIITHNEADNIARCLESVSFCEEIIVVDSESTDETRSIAQRFTKKVFTVPWRGYAAQKNHAISLTEAEWVLSLDADEEVSADLRREIEARLARPPSEDAFDVPRKTIHFGRWIRHGGWYPNRLVRLFRRTKGRWAGEEVHERWETTGACGHLRGDLLHYSFRNLSDQVTRNNVYSSLGAVTLRRQRVAFSTARLLLKPLSKFIETYFIKRGFLDGYPGLIISVSAAYSVFLKWAKLWELENGSQEV